MQNHNETLVIEFDGKMYTLLINDFEDQIDIQSYLKIDYANIIGEVLTFPVIINQISNLKADIEEVVSTKKLALDIKKANLEKDYKTQRSGTKTTNADVESHIILDEGFQTLSKQLIKYQKHLRYLEGFYWSAQSKMSSLMKMTDKMLPTEFTQEILEKSVNNVLIKKANTKI
jgi:hypothetical protein